MHKKIIIALLTIGFSALNGASGIRRAMRWPAEDFTTPVSTAVSNPVSVNLDNQTDVTLRIGFTLLQPNETAVISLPADSNLNFLLNKIPATGRLLMPLAPTTLHDEILHLNRIIFKPTEDPGIIYVTMEAFNDVSTSDDSESADDEEEVITESTDDEAPLAQINEEEEEEEEGLSEDTDDDEPITGGASAVA